MRLHRLTKFGRILRSPSHARALLKYRVAPAVEHEQLAFRHDYRTVIDVGAHQGQFAMYASRRFPNARFHCLEPQPGPAERLERFLVETGRGRVIRAAADESPGHAHMFISNRSDSSSLLEFGEQSEIWPETQPIGSTVVETGLLDELIPEVLDGPILLKLDTQGAELRVLRGATRILAQASSVLIEVSFRRLYVGQPLAAELFQHLHAAGFQPMDLMVTARDVGGVVQVDVVFEAGAETV